MQGQQYKCPHFVTTGSFAVSRQMLHSKTEVPSSGLSPVAVGLGYAGAGGAGAFLSSKTAFLAGVDTVG